MKKLQPIFTRRSLYLALCAALAAPATGAAQDLENDDVGGVVLTEIVVTGLRKSLEDASLFKRESVNFSDAVFSEDVGKFPDLNIAEAINRVPGIQLSREIDGSGVNVAIRGLNTNFTKVTLNGSQIAVASSGKTDAINSNRELDLDVFPTEFFRRLDVSKTTTASMVEGGLSGTVNMRTLRPMDDLNNYLSYQLQGGYGELSEEISPRVSLLGSWKNSDRSFGLLAGVAGVNNRVVTQGYESDGWTNANLTYDQCGATGALPGLPADPSDCSANAGGGNHFVIGYPIAVNPDTDMPTTGAAGYHVVPNNSQIVGSSGTVYGPGSRIDRDFLLDVNPGVTLEQIGNGLIPRMGRPHYSEGDRDRIAGVLSMEWIPNEWGNYYVDVLYAKADRDYNRLSMSMVGRNSQLIPTNMQVDANGIVTRADFHNAQFELEARPYSESLDFISINPGARFFLGDSWIVDAQIHKTSSEWSRESPSLAFETNLNAGVAAHYQIGSDYPLVLPNINLNDPNQIAGWNLERAFVQKEERETETTGARLDFTFGEDLTNIKFGLAYDQVERTIAGRDNPVWEQHVYNQVPAAQISNYLAPGPHGFVMLNYDRFFAATDYAEYLANAQLNTTSNTGAPTGTVDESAQAIYVEGNWQKYFGTRSLRLNAGVRYVNTEQTVAGLQRQGNNFFFNEETHDYENVLPALNLAYDLRDDLVLRGALSRTMTRANPANMLPGFIFVDPSGLNADEGNPYLDPYISDNFDIGLEWYFNDEGYASVNYFRKRIEGFTSDRIRQVTVNQLLNEMQMSYIYLSPSQRDAIDQRGGPDMATVDIAKEHNNDAKLDLQGVELLWVQPLPMVLEGLGYAITLTHVDQEQDGSGAPAYATEVSKNTSNLTAYYENDDFSLRLSYVWYDEQFGSNPNQYNIARGQRFIDARGQWDFSASYNLGQLPTSPKITLNLINFGSDPQRETFIADNAAYRYYDAGYTVILGFRGVLN